MKNDNKGFSLIELIVVIAIMAILVGVLAPNVLKYVESSRESADKQVADTLRTAIMTALVDPTVDTATIPAAGANQSLATFTGATSFGRMVIENAGVSNVGDITGALKSKKYKGGTITISLSTANEVEVIITGTATGGNYVFSTKSGERVGGATPPAGEGG